MEGSLEEFKLYLPKHLTATEKEELLADLRRFPEGSNYLLTGGPDEDLLQGDGWRGFVHIDFETLKRTPRLGVIVSNSCDIDVRNRRDLPTNALFAPVMTLQSFRELLLKYRSAEQAEQKIQSIRRQEITSIFFLPNVPVVGDDVVVFLDDLHSHPLNNFVRSERSLVFRLNQLGFYIFLFKLSIHFTRFGEGVTRFQSKLGS